MRGKVNSEGIALCRKIRWSNIWETVYWTEWHTTAAWRSNILKLHFLPPVLNSRTMWLLLC